MNLIQNSNNYYMKILFLFVNKIQLCSHAVFGIKARILYSVFENTWQIIIDYREIYFRSESF